MAHPHMHRLLSTRAAMVGLAGAAALVPAAPAFAQSLPGAGEAVEVCPVEVLPDQTCEDAVEAAAQAASEVAAPLEAAPAGALDAATDVVEGAVAPAVESIPAPAAPPSVVADVVDQVVGTDSSEGGGTDPVQPGPGAPVPAPPAASGGQAPSTAAGAATMSDPAAEEPVKVEAAGKAPTTEVVEPQAPASDGRVTTGLTTGPTLQPGAGGSNIPGIRSESGLTLQPYDAPVVSIPMEFEVPEVAAPMVSTATPVQEAAATAMRLTGESLVPYTSGAGAWITAAGLGLMGAAGVALRRRADTLDATTMDR